MKHKYTFREMFPSWYRTIEPIPSSATVSSRLAGLNEMLAIDDLSFWLDIVRCALKLPVSNSVNIDKMVEQFRSSDVNFPLTSNENVLNVLSQIALCAMFEEGSDFSDILAEAVSCALFLEQFEKSEIPYYNYALKHLSETHESTNAIIIEHEGKLNECLVSLEDNEDEESIILDDSQNIAIIKSLQILVKDNARLKEETNVLWWLFGEYSLLNEKYFSEIGPLKMIAFAARELSDLNDSSVRLGAAKQLLSKAISISNSGKPLKKKFSIEEIVSSCSKEERQKILHGLPTPIELTPCLLALSVSNEFEELSLWKAAFARKAGNVSVSVAFNAAELSFQLYNEILLLSKM